MSRVRFLIEVKAAGGGWDVTVTGPDLERRGRMESVADGAAERFPVPTADTCPDEDPEHRECLRGGDAIRDAYEQVAKLRAPRAGQTVALGRYLFDALLGQDIWTSITAAARDGNAELIELAMAWDPGDHDLHRLNWELLHDGKQFLLEGHGRADVAITRVVPGAAADLPELDGPPRLLFVIGAAANDPAIRPGAEAIGLLRHIEREGRAIHHRILEAASPDRLARAMREFRPHAVHFICHGEVRAGESVLLLRPDEPDQHEPAPRNATQLRQLLRVDGELPRLVVLSACESGRTGTRLLGGHENAPLAAKLVQGGIPVVVGMAGEVSDLACRMFTREFGKTLVDGRPLVDACGRARRAGLAGGALTGRSVDWALPTVFMDAGIDPARPLVPAGDDATMRLVNGWISSYGLNEKPVFCGRADFVEAYWRMLHGDRAKVLAAFVRGEGQRLGRTRLLHELTKHALRDGHVPLLLDASGTEDTPRTLSAFSKSVERAVTQVRRWLGLPLYANSQLGLVRRHDPARPDAGLDPYIGALLEIDGQATPEVVKLALQADLGRLAADARDRHPHLAAGPGRVMLLLDEVDDGSVELLEKLHDLMLGDHGLGTAEEPVPVVFAFAYSGRDNLLRQLAERQSGKPWLEVRELRAFQPDGEDLLAYEQVMLNPFNKDAVPGVSDQPWVFNRELPPELWEDRVATARQVYKGQPGVFWDPVFYAVLSVFKSKPAPFVTKADDDDLLKRFQEAGQQP